MHLLASALDPAGPVARDIDELWRVMLWLGTATFAVFAGLLVAALARRRPDGRAPTDTGPDDADGGAARRWLVGGGLILPLVGVGAVFAATLATMASIGADATEDGLVVEVTGHQWWWEVSYPDHDVTTANEVHIPAGEPVTVVLSSADVIHSFWVPALAGKLDALPDGENRLTIQADHPGRHDGACAEFCGLQHANMALTVVAHAPDDFVTWLDRQRAPAAEPTGRAAREGQDRFAAAGCGSCHTVRGTDAMGAQGPDLTHLAGRERIAGGVLRLTSTDLERWLRDPHDVKAGTTMPDPQLSPREVEALVAYLAGLE